MHLLVAFKMNVWILLEFILFLVFDFSLCQRQRGALIFQEEFNNNELNSNLWKHWITAWKSTPSEFQYYGNSRNNRLE